MKAMPKVGRSVTGVSFYLVPHYTGHYTGFEKMKMVCTKEGKSYTFQKST